MTFKIDLPEKISLNKIYAGINWRVRRQQAEDFHWAVHLAAQESQISAFPGPFPVDIEYTYHLHGSALDSSNLAYMTKLIEDGLVHSGIIASDNPKIVRSTKMVVGAKGDNYVVVHIST